MGYITFDQLKSTVQKLKDYIDQHGGGGGGAVSSVNGKTGAVVLDASDVGAKPSSYTAPVSSVNGQTGAVQLTLGDSVSVTPKVNTGTNIADIEVNGVTKQLYAPSGGGSTPHPKTKTSSINVVNTRLKNDATLYQPVFLELTCEDGNTYACFAICNAEITATNTMTVYIRQLWGHIFKRVFGQSTGTSYELIPLLTAPYNTALEQFTVGATLETGSTDWYAVSGTGTLVSQYIKGQYGVRSEEVQFT